MNPKAIHGSQRILKPKSTWAECIEKVVLGVTFCFSHSTMTTLRGRLVLPEEFKLSEFFYGSAAVFSSIGEAAISSDARDTCLPQAFDKRQLWKSLTGR